MSNMLAVPARGKSNRPRIAVAGAGVGGLALALALDKAGWTEILGTIAGDDTVIVVARKGADARKIMKGLLDLRERKRRG